MAFSTKVCQPKQRDNEQSIVEKAMVIDQFSLSVRLLRVCRRVLSFLSGEKRERKENFTVARLLIVT